MPVTDTNQEQDPKNQLNKNNPLIDEREDFFDDLLNPDTGEDVISGQAMTSGGFSAESLVITGGTPSRLDKEKSRDKRNRSGRTSPSDIVLDAKERERLAAKNITNEQLKALIKNMPPRMVPNFMKAHVNYIVDDFGIDTRERFSNFMGQVTAESLRGSAEYVYYTSEERIRDVFSGNANFKSNQLSKFKYEDGVGDYGFEINPWEKNGMFDTYYGGRNGNASRNESNAKSDKSQDIDKGTTFDGSQINPFHYTKSTDGYAYRGHGIIQLTGIEKYKKMNDLFGKNGKIEKNDVDFVKTPWAISENPKYAVLAALMFWGNPRNRILYTNKVSLETTRLLTKQVRGSQETYQNRHVNTLRYYDWLLTGGQRAIQGVYTKTVSPTSIRFFNAYEDPRGKSAVEPKRFQDLFGVKTYSNLSYWESSGEPVPPYKDLNANDSTGRRFPVFGITQNGEANIYRSNQINAVWNTLKYACAGFPVLIRDGERTDLPKGPLSFLRRTGRTALGIKGNGDIVVYVAKFAVLEDVQDELLRQGCVDAINFDGGGSTFLYVDGKEIIGSDRKFPTIMTWV